MPVSMEVYPFEKKIGGDEKVLLPRIGNDRAILPDAPAKAGEIA